MLILTPLALAGALTASPRRRTLLQMTIGGTLTVLAVRTAVSWGQSSLIDRVAPRYQAVTSVIVHALTTGFFTTTTWCMVGGFAITAIALLSGPYRWTTAIRAAIRIGGLRVSAMLRFSEPALRSFACQASTRRQRGPSVTRFEARFRTAAIRYVSVRSGPWAG